MKLIFLFTLFFSSSLLAFKDYPIEYPHLTPELIPERLSTGLYVIFKGKVGKPSERPIVQYIKFPDSDAISVLTLLKEEQSETYRFAYSVSNRDLSKSIVTEYKEVSSESVKPISNIYKKMLFNTQYPCAVSGFPIAIHGTYYQFVVHREYGRMIGRTYSPSKEANTGLLVSASDAMELFTKGDLDEQLLLTKLRSYEKEIIRNLKKSKPCN